MRVQEVFIWDTVVVYSLIHNKILSNFKSLSMRCDCVQALADSTIKKTVVNKIWDHNQPESQGNANCFALVTLRYVIRCRNI